MGAESTGGVRALPYPRRVPSLRDATAESPAPVRAVANAVTQWIDKLGGVWVEGQIAQVNRRPGRQHGLHDAARHGGRHLGHADLRSARSSTR